MNVFEFVREFYVFHFSLVFFFTLITYSQVSIICYLNDNSNYSLKFTNWFYFDEYFSLIHSILHKYCRNFRISTKIVQRTVVMVLYLKPSTGNHYFKERSIDSSPFHTIILLNLLKWEWSRGHFAITFYNLVYYYHFNCWTEPLSQIYIWKVLQVLFFLPLFGLFESNIAQIYTSIDNNNISYHLFILIFI